MHKIFIHEWWTLKRVICFSKTFSKFFCLSEILFEAAPFIKMTHFTIGMHITKYLPYAGYEWTVSALNKGLYRWAELWKFYHSFINCYIQTMIYA